MKIGQVLLCEQKLNFVHQDNKLRLNPCPFSSKLLHLLLLHQLPSNIPPLAHKIVGCYWPPTRRNFVANLSNQWAKKQVHLTCQCKLGNQWEDSPFIWLFFPHFFSKLPPTLFLIFGHYWTKQETNLFLAINQWIKPILSLRLLTLSTTNEGMTNTLASRAFQGLFTKLKTVHLSPIFSLIHSVSKPPQKAN